MAKTPEGRVKDDIKAWLKDHGFWAAGGPEPKWPERTTRGWYYMPQNMGMGVNGIPDFMGSFLAQAGYPDAPETVWRPFGIEAKAPGGKPTQIQLDRHAEMRATGWLVFVVDDVSQLADLQRYMA